MPEPTWTPSSNAFLARGGKVLVPKTQIAPEVGSFAVFLDTEGNKVALSSRDNHRESSMIAALLALVFVSSSHIPADTPTVKNVSWMLGCWVTEPGETTSWESWVKATDHEMYG